MHTDKDQFGWHTAIQTVARMAKVGAKGPRVILDQQDPRLADLLAFIERALVGK